MDHFFGVVDVCKSLNELSEEEFRDVLLESPSLFNVCEKIAARTQFNHKADVFLGLKSVEKSDYIWMITLLQYAHFKLGPTSLISLTLQSLFAHRLDCYQLLGQLVHSQTDFPKCSLSEHPANSVELASSRRSTAEVFEIHSDHLFELF